MPQFTAKEILYLFGAEHPHQLKHSIIGRGIPVLFVVTMSGVLIS